MDNKNTKSLGNVVHIDDNRVKEHLGELVRGTVEETLNAMLDAEADELCGAQRYERSPDRVDTRAGSYSRQFHTKAGEVTLKVPNCAARPLKPPLSSATSGVKPQLRNP